MTCYNSSQLSCLNDTLCYPSYLCGTQCMYKWLSNCVKNQTICEGYNHWDTNVDICGSQQQCYDSATSVCLNGTNVCQGLNAQLCGTTCFNPDTQFCTSGTVGCINSCNGTCYSNSQYCYNNTKVCNNGELVCDMKIYNEINGFSLLMTCYNSSQLSCCNDTLCYPSYLCGTQCMYRYYSTCVKNQTICEGYVFWNRNVNLCGSQQQCYDNTTNVCIGNNDTVCPVGNQLCSGVCYNPQTQYCTGGNNTIYCLNNPSSPNCLLTSTTLTSSTSTTRTTTMILSTSTTTAGTSAVITTVRTSTRITAVTARSTSSRATASTSTIRTTITAVASSICCAIKNCTTNADCCRPGLLECQCYRHIQTDVYGLCLNPYVTPICGDNCPVQGKCKYDFDCCRCQCANVTFTDPDGQLVTKKQCAQR